MNKSVATVTNSENKPHYAYRDIIRQSICEVER